MTNKTILKDKDLPVGKTGRAWLEIDRALNIHLVYSSHRTVEWSMQTKVINIFCLQWPPLLGGYSQKCKTSFVTQLRQTCRVVVLRFQMRILSLWYSRGSPGSEWSSWWATQNMWSSVSFPRGTHYFWHAGYIYIYIFCNEHIDCLPLQHGTQPDTKSSLDLYTHMLHHIQWLLSELWDVVISCITKYVVVWHQTPASIFD